MQRVLVTGATGNVGQAALQALQALGVPVRAAVRPGPPPDGLAAVETVGLDLTEPATWEAALAGVDGLFLMRPPAISDMGPTLNAFVDRGLSMGLRRVAFLSVSGAEKNRIIPHAAVERHLRGLGERVAWTFLRAGFFAQNLCGAYREDIRDDDRLFVPAGAGQVAWVDTRDLGEAAARALLDPAAVGVAWRLTGPETRTFGEVAAILSEVLERPIRYEPASILAYLRHQRQQRGQPWAPAAIYTALHLAIRWGGEATVDPTLEQVLGRRPRTIRDTIRDHRDLWMTPSPVPAP